MPPPKLYGTLSTLSLLLTALALTLLALLNMWLPILAQRSLPKGEGMTLLDFCPPGATPGVFRWTGVEVVDHQICLLTTFFNLALSTPHGPLTSLSLASSLLPPLITIYLQPLRPHTPLPTRYPGAWLFLCQNLGMGLILPLYFAALLLGRAGGRPASRRVEGALWGVGVGYGLLTSVMWVMPGERVTAIWQFFPFFIWLVQLLHSWLRPASASASASTSPSNRAADARRSIALIRLAYKTSIVICTAAHLYILYTAPPRLLPLTLQSALQAWEQVWLPQPMPAHTQVPEHLWTTLMNFFKWDLWFIFASTLLAGAAGWVQASGAGKESGKAGGQGGGSGVGMSVGKMVIGLLVGVVGGPGALMGWVWLGREEALDRSLELGKGKEA